MANDIDISNTRNYGKYNSFTGGDRGDFRGGDYFDFTGAKRLTENLSGEKTSPFTLGSGTDARKKVMLSPKWSGAHFYTFNSNGTRNMAGLIVPGKQYEVVSTYNNVPDILVNPDMYQIKGSANKYVNINYVKDKSGLTVVIKNAPVWEFNSSDGYATITSSTVPVGTQLNPRTAIPVWVYGMSKNQTLNVYKFSDGVFGNPRVFVDVIKQNFTGVNKRLMDNFNGNTGIDLSSGSNEVDLSFSGKNKCEVVSLTEDSKTSSADGTGSNWLNNITDKIQGIADKIKTDINNNNPATPTTPAATSTSSTKSDDTSDTTIMGLHPINFALALVGVAVVGTAVVFGLNVLMKHHNAKNNNVVKA